MTIRTIRDRSRWIAAIGLAATLVGIAEPALGLGREGEVHHAETADAAIVAPAAYPVVRAESPHPEHSPQHQHHTGLDHCTHLHGLALTADPLIDAISTLSSYETRVDRLLPPDVDPVRAFHPPRD